MQKLTTHYQQLLGLPASWEVEDVNLSLTGQRVEVRLRFIGNEVFCSECGLQGTVYDHAPEQRWRHLDTMQFETIIIARIPRSQCTDCGVKTIKVPWADRHSRFTLMFESFAIALLQHCSNTQAASKMLRLGWQATSDIMNRAVKRGLSRRAPEKLSHIGIDEKSFKSGHHYITILNDVDGSRVLDVVEDRTTEATEMLLQTLTQSQQNGVASVSVDMWKPFASAVKKLLPQADIVHDRFHISKYLNTAVDIVRRQESRQLCKTGDTSLVGSKFTWLRNPENMNTVQKGRFDGLMESMLETGMAWALKNSFRVFWECPTEARAKLFFSYWCEVVDKSGLKPMIKVKGLLKRHSNNILNYFKHWVTNAVSEGLNSKIQMLKASARGFHNFESYRARILFYCGKLDMRIDSVPYY